MARRGGDFFLLAGTVTKEDTAMYRLGKEAALADGPELAAFAKDAADEILAAVVAADVAGPRWVVRVEDHIKNLPPDPEQASWSQTPSAC